MQGARALDARRAGARGGRAWAPDAGCAGAPNVGHQTRAFRGCQTREVQGREMRGPRVPDAGPRVPGAVVAATTKEGGSTMACGGGFGGGSDGVAVALMWLWQGEATRATVEVAAHRRAVRTAMTVMIVGLLPRSSSSSYSSRRTLLLFSNDG